MISDLFFIMKMFGLAVLVTLVMQVKIGNNKTVEDNFHYWIKNSVLVDQVQISVDGGMAIAKVGYAKAHSVISTMLAKVGRKHSTDRADQIFGGAKLKRYFEGEDAESDHLSPSQTHSKSETPYSE